MFWSFICHFGFLIKKNSFVRVWESCHFWIPGLLLTLQNASFLRPWRVCSMWLAPIVIFLVTRMSIIFTNSLILVAGASNPILHFVFISSLISGCRSWQPKPTFQQCLTKKSSKSLASQLTPLVSSQDLPILDGLYRLLTSWHCSTFSKLSTLACCFGCHSPL